MADVRQFAMLRRRQDAEYQGLHEIIEFLNEMRKGFMATMERKHKLMSGAWNIFGRGSVRRSGTWTTGSRRTWSCWRK